MGFLLSLFLSNAPCRQEYLAPVPFNLFDFSGCSGCFGDGGGLEGSLGELQTTRMARNRVRIVADDYQLKS
jgi:hypothetical protein